MADVTISQLTREIPSGNSIVPYSSGGSTFGMPVSGILQGSTNAEIATLTYPNFNYSGAGSGKATLSIGDLNLADSCSIRLSQRGGTHIIGNNRPESASNHVILPTALNADFVINNAVRGPGTSIILATSGLERARIDKDGNVGINVNNPQTKLEVGGDISIKTPAGPRFYMKGDSVNNPGNNWYTVHTFNYYASTGFMLMVSYEDSDGDGSNVTGIFVDSGSFSWAGSTAAVTRLIGSTLLEVRKLIGAGSIPPVQLQVRYAGTFPHPGGQGTAQWLQWNMFLLGSREI